MLMVPHGPANPNSRTARANSPNARTTTTAWHDPTGFDSHHYNRDPREAVVDKMMIESMERRVARDMRSDSMRGKVASFMGKQVRLEAEILRRQESNQHANAARGQVRYVHASAHDVIAERDARIANPAEVHGPTGHTVKWQPPPAPQPKSPKRYGAKEAELEPEPVAIVEEPKAWLQANLEFARKAQPPPPPPKPKPSKKGGKKGGANAKAKPKGKGKKGEAPERKMPPPPTEPKIVHKTSQEVVSRPGHEVGAGKHFISRLGGAHPDTSHVQMSEKHKKVGFGVGHSRAVGTQEGGHHATRQGWAHSSAAYAAKQANPKDTISMSFSPFRVGGDLPPGNGGAEEEGGEEGPDSPKLFVHGRSKSGAQTARTRQGAGQGNTLREATAFLKTKPMNQRNFDHQPHSLGPCTGTEDAVQNRRTEVELIREQFNRLGIKLKGGGGSLDRALVPPNFHVPVSERGQFCSSMPSLMKNPFHKPGGKGKKKGGKKKKKQWKFQKKAKDEMEVVEGRFTDQQLQAVMAVVSKTTERDRMELFDHDWRLLPDALKDIVGKDTRLLTGIQDMYRKYYDQFCFMFDFYSTPSKMKQMLAAINGSGKDGEANALRIWSGQAAGTMSMMHFVNFCQICNIPDKVLTVKMCEDLFYKCTRPMGADAEAHRHKLAAKLFDSSASMTRAHWLETLIRLSLLKFGNRLMYLDMDAAKSLETLFIQFIEIYAIDTNKHVSIQRQLLEDNVHEEFKNYQEELYSNFSEFASKDHKITIANTIECLDKHYGVDDKGLTVNLVVHHLDNHDTPPPGGNLDLEDTLVYPEFLIVCGMVADKRYEPVDTSHSSPDVPLSMKVNMLMTKQPPAGNSDELRDQALEEGILDEAEDVVA